MSAATPAGGGGTIWPADAAAAPRRTDITPKSTEETAMSRIELLVSDVDGTLVTPEKLLTPAAIEAVRQLRACGIKFTVTSARPPFGMRGLCAPLGLDLPMGPFNGSSIVDPDMTVREEHNVPRDAVTRSLALFDRYGIDFWIFTNQRWFIRRDGGHYVAHEKMTIATDPVIAPDETPFLDTACKLVGVSADYPLLAGCEAELRAALGATATVALSQNYYLDVTPPGCDKGTFVESLGALLDIPLAAIATIGDMTNDLPMFSKSGFSFAMGSASEAVKARATHRTASNEEDGFAKAVAAVLALNG